MKHSEASQMSFNTPTHDSDRAPRRWAAWRRHGGGGVVVPVVLVCEVLLGTLTPPQFGHCWSSLTVVSETYLLIMRAVRMGPLTDPKFTVSTTSTHFHLSKHPHHHSTLTHPLSSILDTQRAFRPHTDPSTRGGALPDASLHCARSESRVYGRTGAGTPERTRSTDFKPR